MAEARDATLHQVGGLSPRGIGAGLGVIVAGIALAVGVPWIVIALVDTPANAPNNASKPALRAPVQETAPEADLAAFRAEKMRRLESAGVDSQTGRAYIPIEQAMQLLVQRAAGKGAPR